ncbi:P-loop containing nucleoside triphosphate hydrolase protein [Mycena capillaripes]|nr:P-loop containing nucleoside triphosphate hydrolase protein [Mycena capillaripes]
MLSPEMLLSRRFVDGVLRKSEFGSRCLSVFIDEAHCVSHWGASFRKKYASIGIIRAFLPRTTSIIAVTATLTPRVRQDLVTKLQFDRHTYMYQNEIPADTFVYTDDIKDGGKIIDHLNARVHPSFRSRGIVRPYNAGMSRKYRAHVMTLFKAGIVRVLVCTDAAGMGCDIPDIELVVQWKMPANLSAWVQRAGRAARDVPASHCCDICNPKLFDQVRPSRPIQAVRQKGIRKGPPVDCVREALFVWRRNILKADYPGRYFAAHAILDDATCELLSSVRPIDTIETLQKLLGSSWSRWDELGRRLFVYIKGLNIPPLPPPPTRQKQAPALPNPPSNASTSNMPPSALSSTQAQPPSSAVPNVRKRRSTALPDAGAPPTVRPRVQNTESALPRTPFPPPYQNFLSATPQTPVIPRPKPKPTYKGYVEPSGPLHPSMPPIPLVPTYTPPVTPSMPLLNYLPPQYMAHYYSNVSYPGTPLFTYTPTPGPSTVPATLQYNLYASLYSPRAPPPIVPAAGTPAQPSTQPPLPDLDNSPPN